MSAVESVSLPQGKKRVKSARSLRRTVIVHTLQFLLLAAILAAWQWVPSIPGAADLSPAFDRFFISSPELVAKTLYYLATGTNQTPSLWVPFQQSLVPALAGTGIAIAAGAFGGLVCSNWQTLNRVVRPFLVIGNALPRITLIPIIVVLFGPTSSTDMTIGFLVVFFLIFWNAYEGGVSVPQETLENVKILGANGFQTLRRVRLPYVLVWTFASLPAAIGFGLTAVITAELFTGSTGLGMLLLIAVQNAQADLTFAITIVVGLTGLVLVGAASVVRKRILHWW